MYAFYERLTPQKITLNEFAEIMKSNEKIDSVTFVDETSLRRLYFRYEFGDDFQTFPQASKELHSKELIYHK